MSTTESTFDPAAAIVQRVKADHPKIKTEKKNGYVRLTLDKRVVGYVNDSGRKGSRVYVPLAHATIPADVRKKTNEISNDRTGVLIAEAKQIDLAAKLIGIAVDDAAAKKAAAAPARETRPTPANADSPPADTVKVDAALDGPAKPDPKTPAPKKTPAKK